METPKPVKSDAQRVKEICDKTGLSEFSLSVYTAMTDKTHPLRISSLFRVVCPNREGIRSLSIEKIREFEKTYVNTKGMDVEENDDNDESTVSTITKKSKKSSDDWRRCIIKAREAELTKNGIKIGGTAGDTKKIPPRQKELQLIWEYLGWGQTSANFYVYVYYIGPENKGVDFIELTRTENWHIVPEAHLVLFHKYMGDVHNYFHQTPLSVKESSGNAAHIDYDVRYILHKWKNGQKAARKDQIALVNANRELFEHKKTMRVKYDRKRCIELDEEMTDEVKVESPAKKSRTEKVKKEKKEKKDKKKDRKKEEKPVPVPIIQKDYEVKDDKYRRVTVDEYLNVTRYPLGLNTMTFDIRDIDTMINNAITDPARKPASNKWDPTEKIIKPWMIASNMVRLRKQIVQTLLKKYNLCFESSDLDAIHYFISNNKEAADDIKQHFDQFTWSYSLFNVLTMRGFVPDAIDDLV